MVVNGAKISFKWKNGLVTQISNDTAVNVLNMHLNKSLIKDSNIYIQDEI